MDEYYQIKFFELLDRNEKNWEEIYKQTRMLYPEIWNCVKYKYDRSLLHFAVQDQQEEFIHFLIKEGTDVNPTDKYGNTPLHLAVKTENENIIRLLIHAGADISIKNDYGQTPLDICLDPDITKILQPNLQSSPEQKSYELEIAKMKQKIKELEEPSLVVLIREIKNLTTGMRLLRSELRKATSSFEQFSREYQRNQEQSQEQNNDQDQSYEQRDDQDQ